MYSRIIGTGRYLPEKIVSNDDLSKFLDTSDDWIYPRTGIRYRHIADKEGSYDMASYAALKALENANVNAEEIDLIILATITAEYQTPSIACIVQKQIKATNAMCLDINAACTGFVYGLDIVDQFIASGKYKKALVIGVEKLSHTMNWEDKSTCILFGDGAGAVVVEASEEKGIIDVVNHSIGEDWDALTYEIQHEKTPFYETQRENGFNMDGRKVFDFATKKVRESIKEVLEKNKTDINDIDLFVLHQANERIINRIAKKLEVDIDKFYMNMKYYGNTSSASIPIALDELREKNMLEGKKVVLSGFGAGLTYGSSIIQF